MPETSTIHPEITMRELLENYPGAQRALFKRYHIGGCASCGFQPTETLAGVCERNERLPVNEVMDYILASHEDDLKMQITPAELSRRLKEEEGVRLVDIRTREEFDAARLAGSVLFTQELMQEILSKWDREKLVVMIDHHGTRSMDAAAYFAGHGFKAVKSLTGGVDAWSQEVDPSVPRYHLE